MQGTDSARECQGENGKTRKEREGRIRTNMGWIATGGHRRLICGPQIVGQELNSEIEKHQKTKVRILGAERWGHLTK